MISSRTRANVLLASDMPEMSTADSMPGRIFLCHSAGDNVEVRNLYQRLRDDGFFPWLDQEDLLPGQEWSQEIPKAVRLSVVVLVCLSQKSRYETGYVQKEIKHALDVADEQPEGGIFLIPVRLENCDVPERLRRWQGVDLFEKRGYDKLVEAIRTRLPAEPDSKKTEILGANSGKAGGTCYSGDRFMGWIPCLAAIEERRNDWPNEGRR